MRSIICVILVMVLCMSMAMPAFAVDKASVADSGKPSATPSGTNPKTGDIIMMWVVIMLVALLALGVVIFCYRKFAR